MTTVQDKVAALKADLKRRQIRPREAMDLMIDEIYFGRSEAGRRCDPVLAEAAKIVLKEIIDAL